MEENCGTCRFVMKGEPKKDLSPREMFCRRFPPVPLLMPQQVPGGMQVTTIGAFAPVRPDTWCGEWSPHPEKLS